LKKWTLIFIAFVLFSCAKEKTDLPIDKAQKDNHEIVTTKEHLIEQTVQEQLKLKIPPQVEKVVINNNSKIKPFKFTKGIYLSAYSVSSKRFSTILDSAQAAGINTVVFDLKNMNGDVFFRTPKFGDIRDDRRKMSLDIPKIVSTLHERNMRAVSRIVCFHDQFLAREDSTLRIPTKAGNAWKESKKRKPSWLDSSNPIVQSDILYLIEQAARNGVDEVQLDYVRFPTGGKLSETYFHFMQQDSIFTEQDSNYINRAKPDIIEDFIERAQEICNNYGTTLAADIFAIVAWQHKQDIANTGQDIARLTKHLQMLHPMIYSSHFADNFGYRKDVPNEPYFLLYKGTKLSKNYSNQNCHIVPYIQANNWRVNYKPEYIYAQIEAIKEAGGDGYILWNASNKYMKTLRWIKLFD
jgi:hypothetical protein